MKMAVCIVVAMLILFPVLGHAVGNEEKGATASRFVQGYEQGYQHGFEDGYIRGHSSIEQAMKAEQELKARETQEYEEPTEQGKSSAPGGYSPKESFAEFSSKLNLTPEQQNHIRPILNDEARQIQGIAEDKSLSREQKRQKIMNAIDSTGSRVKIYLSPDQQTLYDRLVQERKKAYQQTSDVKNK